MTKYKYLGLEQESGDVGGSYILRVRYLPGVIARTFGAEDEERSYRKVGDINWVNVSSGKKCSRSLDETLSLMFVMNDHALQVR